MAQCARNHIVGAVEMAAFVDATPKTGLLPPVAADQSDRFDVPSQRRLDDIGVETVMGAMLDKAKSRVLTLDMEDFEDTPRSQRVPVESDAFLKAR